MSKKSAIGIVFNDQKDQVLLVKRRDVPVWVLPGGGVDADEAPTDAAIREVFEETGLTVNIQRHIAIYSPINRLSNRTYLFECQMIDGKLTTGDETREIAFFPLTKLPSTFFFIHRDWLYDAMKNSEEIIKNLLIK